MEKDHIRRNKRGLHQKKYERIILEDVRVALKDVGAVLEEVRKSCIKRDRKKRYYKKQRKVILKKLKKNCIRKDEEKLCQKN